MCVEGPASLFLFFGIPWLLVIDAFRAEKVKPMLSVRTHVDITVREIEDHKSCILVDVANRGSLVPKSHVLWLASCFLSAAAIRPSSITSGSSVIFMFDQKSILVGADSKTYGIEGMAHANACKIAVSPAGLIFANAGILNEQDGTSFIDLARDVLKDTRTVSEAASRFEAIVRPRLERLATRMRIAMPDYYAREVERKPWYQAAFARVTESGPQIAVRTFEPQATETQVTIRVRQLECLTGCPGKHVGLGHFDNIDRAFAGKLPTVRSAEEAVRYLIGLEIAASPMHVGPPIIDFRII